MTSEPVQCWVRKKVDPVQPILHTSRECFHFDDDTQDRPATVDEIDRGWPCESCDPWRSPAHRSQYASRSGIEQFLSRRQTKRPN